MDFFSSTPTHVTRFEARFWCFGANGKSGEKKGHIKGRTCRTPAPWTPATKHGAEGFGEDRGQMEGGRD